jgi:hypothetical protein
VQVMVWGASLTSGYTLILQYTGLLCVSVGLSKSKFWTVLHCMYQLIWKSFTF